MGNVFALPTNAPIPQGQRDGVAVGSNGTFVASSFGRGLTTTGAEFSAKSFVQSERYRELEGRERFYRCTQHDWKMFDFNGRMIRPGPPTSQPMLSAANAPHYVPLEMRRPNSPYRLARVIVNAFTGLLFGYDRWPAIRNVDPMTQDFANELAKEANLASVMIRARNIGGSVGTVGLSWKFVDGKPRVIPHNGKHLHVHAWVDRDELVPSHVSEVYQFPRDEFDAEKKQVVRKWFWFRRDWTLDADIQFVEVEAGNDEPEWIVDESRSFRHDDGFAHFVWIQNLPENDATNVDGACDYAELYENFNSIDVLNSVTVRGASLNLDPTLKLKMDPQLVNRFGIRKGSDNALAVGKDGDASYMELSGSSMSVGIQLFQNQRSAILEVAQCVIPDPNTITAAGTSSVALKIVYSPMLSKGSVLRTQYGRAIERVLSQMTRSARKFYTSTDVEVDFEPDETGALHEVERPVRWFLALDPRVEVVPVLDPATNEPTDETMQQLVERTPGDGGDIRVEWGEFFKATAQDNQVTVTTMSTAVGGKPVMSRRAAVEVSARTYGFDPQAELDEVLAEERKAAEASMQMFPSIGGEVPPDATATDAAPAPELVAPEAGVDAALNPVVAEKTQKLELTASDLASIVSVNEGRTSVGYGPLMRADGTPDPDGDLTISEFQAKRAAKGEALGAAIGEALSPKTPEPKTTPTAATAHVVYSGDAVAGAPKPQGAPGAAPAPASPSPAPGSLQGAVPPGGKPPTE